MSFDDQPDANICWGKWEEIIDDWETLLTKSQKQYNMEYGWVLVLWKWKGAAGDKAKFHGFEIPD